MATAFLLFGGIARGLPVDGGAKRGFNREGPRTAAAFVAEFEDVTGRKGDDDAGRAGEEDGVSAPRAAADIAGKFGHGKKGSGGGAPLPFRFPQLRENSSASDQSALLSFWPSCNPPTGRVVLRRNREGAASLSVAGTSPE